MARRRKKTKGKRRLKGIGSKIGAILIGVVPPASSALEAGVFASGVPGTDMISKAQVWFFRFVNNLTTGYSLPRAYDQVNVIGTDGRLKTISINDGWGGATPHLWTTISGLIAIGVDAAVGKLTKSANKIAGITVTGN